MVSPTSTQNEHNKNDKTKPIQKRVDDKNEKSKHSFNTGCWNIRRGLLRREPDLKALLCDHQMDIAFLVETDCKFVNLPEDYYIEGFRTVVQRKNNKEEQPTQIICLIDKKSREKIKIREDLMSNEFPTRSIYQVNMPFDFIFSKSLFTFIKVCKNCRRWRIPSHSK